MQQLAQRICLFREGLVVFAVGTLNQFPIEKASAAQQEQERGTRIPGGEPQRQTRRTTNLQEHNLLHEPSGSVSFRMDRPPWIAGGGRERPPRLFRNRSSCPKPARRSECGRGLRPRAGQRAQATEIPSALNRDA